MKTTNLTFALPNTDFLVLEDTGLGTEATDWGDTTVEFWVVFWVFEVLFVFFGEESDFS